MCHRHVAPDDSMEITFPTPTKCMIFFVFELSFHWCCSTDDSAPPPKLLLPYNFSIGFCSEWHMTAWNIWVIITADKNSRFTSASSVPNSVFPYGELIKLSLKKADFLLFPIQSNCHASFFLSSPLLLQEVQRPTLACQNFTFLHSPPRKR